jgi:hypothetical protein
MENIFRCYYCYEIKSMDFHKDFNGINLCVKCYPIYDKLVNKSKYSSPSRRSEYYKDEDDDKDIKCNKKKR